MTGTRHRRDLAAGLAIGVFGVGTVAVGRQYPIGSLTQMGPGFFPIILGAISIGLGLLIAIVPSSVGERGHDAAPALDWRGWSCIVGGMSLFIALAENGGLAPATFACVAVSSLGDRTATIKGSLLLAAGLTVFVVALFGLVLKVQLPILGWQ